MTVHQNSAGGSHRHQSYAPEATPEHRAPSDCPVCGEHLVVTRLGCASCGTELAGIFAPCEFCALSAAELDMLRVFLAARGNLRELEKHLGVSYPTARARFTELLQKMGLAEPEPAPDVAAVPTRDQILAEVAAGALSPAEAARLIGIKRNTARPS